MRIAIIDYGSGNLHSTAKAFERVASEMGKEVIVTSDPKIVAKADHIVLPGVGAFGDCMSGLTAVSGMIDMLNEQVAHKQKPFIGICVGMQLLAEKGLEHGEHKGLSWFKGTVERITPKDASLKIPHMGWNDLMVKGSHPFVKGVTSGDHAYFVHSYAMRCANQNDVQSTVDYGGTITAIIARDNVMGTQFHPEKSQETGMKLIRNFLSV
ncbi:MAG: imidazole glycerol phosphate synthase subunit HisH [Proteobacteria bacterium]|nr:imidazole glycerol phosphate synthase subunit HisH [Pseudomonadota bacterium]